MSEHDNAGTQGARAEDAQTEGEQIRHDKRYSPASERETENRQQHVRRSEATDDPDIDTGDIKVLPGTGGPDDPGDVDVDPDDIRLP